MQPRRPRSVICCLGSGGGSCQSGSRCRTSVAAPCRASRSTHCSRRDRHACCRSGRLLARPPAEAPWSCARGATTSSSIRGKVLRLRRGSPRPTACPPSCCATVTGRHSNLICRDVWRMTFLPRALSGLLHAAGLDEMLADLGGGRGMLAARPVLAPPPRLWPALAALASLGRALRAADSPGCWLRCALGTRQGPMWGCGAAVGPGRSRRFLRLPRSGTRGAAARQRRTRRGGGLQCGGAPHRVKRGPAWRGEARRLRARLPLRRRQRGMAHREQRCSL